jgi:hypothetical protein
MIIVDDGEFLPFPVFCFSDEPCGPSMDSLRFIKDLRRISWICYWYESGSYEGNGRAFAQIDGEIYSKGLGHCSCHGPWCNIEAPMEMGDWVGPIDRGEFALSLIEDMGTALNEHPREMCQKMLELVEVG